MKRLCGLILFISMLATMCFTGFAAEEQQCGENTIEQADVSLSEDAIIAYVEEWFFNNYSPYYDITDERFEITHIFTYDESTNYTVAIYCQTKLKANSVEELPFVQGLYAGVKEISLGNELSPITEEAVDNYINSIDFSKDFYTLTLDVVVAVNNTAATMSNIDNTFNMYFQDGTNTTLYPITVLTLDSAQMYEDGKTTAESIMTTLDSDAVGTYSD
ncbi:MAG: hypothetical protein LUC20_04105 [Oscillospiraceae bacterium]|nr:hypothetical protein [Oscillospiraceae bacterium]